MAKQSILALLCTHAISCFGLMVNTGVNIVPLNIGTFVPHQHGISVKIVNIPGSSRNFEKSTAPSTYISFGGFLYPSDKLEHLRGVYQKQYVQLISKIAPRLKNSPFVRRKNALCLRGGGESNGEADEFTSIHRSSKPETSPLSPFLEPIPRALRFCISLTIGNGLYFLMYYAMLARATTAAERTSCLLLAYAASILWQHALHRMLVFDKGLTLNSQYLRELAEMYGAYSIGFVLMPALSEGCIAVGRSVCAGGVVCMPAVVHRIKAAAFWVAFLITGAVNFVLVNVVLSKPAAAE